MDCASAAEAMSAALDRELGAAESTELRRHLDGCAACRAHRRELLDVERALRAPAARRTRVPAPLRARVETLVAAKAQRSRWRRRTGWGVALIGAAALGGLAVGMIRRPPAPPPAVVVNGAGAAEEQVSPAPTSHTLHTLDVGTRVEGALELLLHGRARVSLAGAAAMVILDGREAAARLETGRASFDVEPGPGSFRIDTPLGHVVVLGTRFAIALAADGVQGVVTVEEGRVRVENAGRALVVAAGEQAVMLAAGAPKREPRPAPVAPAAVVLSPGYHPGPGPTASPPIASAVATTGQRSAGPAGQSAAETARPSSPSVEPAKPVAVGAGVVAVTTTTGMIRGVVELEGAPPVSEAERRLEARCEGTSTRAWQVKDGKLANVVVQIAAEFRDPRVWLRTSSPKAVMSLHECGFVPRVLPVTSDRLELRAADTQVHSVVMRTPFRTHLYVNVPSGPLALSNGLYHLECEVHRDVVGYAVPVQNRFFAVTDENGAFTIADVPPGRNKLIAWHEQGGEQVVKDVVVQAGAITEVRLKYRAPGAEPAEPAAPEAPGPAVVAITLPPLLTGTSCVHTRATDGLVARACRVGGTKEAKKVMKELVKLAKTRGLKRECDDCHKEDDTFALTDDARDKLQALIEVAVRR